MFDRNGSEILQGVTLYSCLFDKAGPKMKCFGYHGIDGKIILGQERSGEQVIHLTQEELLTTHCWVIDPGFEKEEEEFILSPDRDPAYAG